MTSSELVKRLKIYRKDMKRNKMPLTRFPERINMNAFFVVKEKRILARQMPEAPRTG